MLKMGFRQPNKARSPQAYVANPLGNTALDAGAQRVFAMKCWGSLLLACLLKRFMIDLSADGHGAWFVFAARAVRANRTGTTILPQKADVDHRLRLPRDILLEAPFATRMPLWTPRLLNTSHDREGRSWLGLLNHWGQFMHGQPLSLDLSAIAATCYQLFGWTPDRQIDPSVHLAAIQHANYPLFGLNPSFSQPGAIALKKVYLFDNSAILPQKIAKIAWDSVTFL